MFKSYGNNISIPNNYVYTSNKGTEYMYLDGSWMNCSTLNIVESTHNFKMNKSALQQINEHNTSNELQIGKSYKVNKTAYTYVGRGNFTINGNLLSESINTRVKNLFEAEDNKFSDLKLGDKNSTEIPSYFKMGDYIYRKGAWFHKGDRVIKKDDNLEELNAEAKDYIKKLNNNPHEVFPVGTTVQYRGNTLTYVGDAFVDLQNGNEYPEAYMDRIKNYAKQEMAQNGEESNSSDAPAQDSAKGTVVPDGYVYTSGKGKKYFKKNGRWFSSETKQPINQSAAAPLERAAQAAIVKHNSTETVKIGTEWKSKKGVSYKYVGDGRFISDSGKLLPSDISRKVLDDMSSKAEQGDTDTQDQSDEAPEVNVGGAGSDTEQNRPQPDQGRQQPPAQNGAPQGSEESGLQGLADRIKASPLARNIVVLLSRGDEVSLLAADIILAGKQREATEILNSLNTTD